MTRDDISRMAREAGMHDPMIFIGAYERFAKLVAAFAAEREREECAKLCEKIGDQDCGNHAWDATYAIRARGTHD